MINNTPINTYCKTMIFRFLVYQMKMYFYQTEIQIFNKSRYLPIIRNTYLLSSYFVQIA